MAELVVLSGKGGTGKTSLTAALAHLAAAAGDDILPVLVDADVDASNLDLLLGARRIFREPFQGGSVAVIEPARCTSCGRCQEVCRFEAVHQREDQYWIDPIACEGCAACLYECPETAIYSEEQQAGEWYISETDCGRLFHAHLFPARENSGRLVAHIKRQAKKARQESGAGWLLVDGPPGIGCPVISSISGADAALIVTEPSLAGIHDLKRILATVEYFQIPPLICINKADLYLEGRDEIRDLCQDSELPLVGEIPYQMDIPRAMAEGVPVTAFQPDGEAAQAVSSLWANILQRIGSGYSAGNPLNLRNQTSA